MINLLDFKNMLFISIFLESAIYFFLEIGMYMVQSSLKPKHLDVVETELTRALKIEITFHMGSIEINAKWRCVSFKYRQYLN